MGMFTTNVLYAVAGVTVVYGLVLELLSLPRGGKQPNP
jgi:hypothetical protein